MRTVGIDLAARASKTAVATVAWSADGARVVELVIPATDDDIVARVLASDVAGLDVPLGWPIPFIEFMQAQRDGVVEPFAYEDMWSRMAFRTTDLRIRERYGVSPLSVSTDRLGLTALRATSLLIQLRLNGVDVNRAGTGRLAEVYPAVALRQWGLPTSSYKGNDATARETLFARMKSLAPWLDFNGFEAICTASHDAFDAVVCALIARAHALGLTVRPEEGDLEAASVEGWICVPNCGLDRLLSG
jgi:predicted nuclease with RNAse H fold